MRLTTAAASSGLAMKFGPIDGGWSIRSSSPSETTPRHCSASISIGLIKLLGVHLALDRFLNRVVWKSRRVPRRVVLTGMGRWRQQRATSNDSRTRCSYREPYSSLD